MMKRSQLWKLGGVLLVTVLCGVWLYPSVRYYSMTPPQREATPPADLKKLRDSVLPLGLDLQGGMQLLLQVECATAGSPECSDAVDRAREILNQRIDQFGVAEPLIQREGEDRIAIQLPGMSDRQRAIDLIGKTALLEFKLVRSPEESRATYERLDTWLAARGAGGTLDTLLRRNPLTSHFLTIDAAAFVREQDLPTVESLLATPGIDSIIPADSQLHWGTRNDAQQGVSGRYLYLLKREPEMTGGSVATAEAAIGLDQTNPSAWGVSLQMSPQGRADFARVTSNNVQRFLAIVLDGVVNSAPQIRERISGGTASITGGNFDTKTSKDLAIVLRAGALPAPVRIIEERSVGPSLGSDSVRQGWIAGLIGTGLVVGFMVVYYQLSGAVAVAAMVFNMLIVIAVMVPLRAALTLPGIAGLVLTVGMSVDANVLIFERIREELRQGKSVRSAVELGYDRAFRTILDAHVTTLLAAAFLFQFGTGPIKGFAVTLSIGLIANMFTAVFFTRMIFDSWLGRARAERLSI
jgi:protein-export membrane protein SecD